jgi:hypothetical protein
MQEKNGLNEVAEIDNQPVQKTGGLYKNVKMSVKTANIIVVIGAIVLLSAIFFLANHNGFTVKFDTDGGSYIESAKVMYSE